MKTLLLSLLFTLFYLSGFAQVHGQFYKIGKRYTLTHVTRGVKNVQKSNTITRSTSKGAVTETVNIIETSTVSESDIKSVERYVPETHKANLVQNAKGDSIEVQFWSFEDEPITKEEIKAYKIKSSIPLTQELKDSELETLQSEVNKNTKYTGAEANEYGINRLEINPNDDNGKYYILFDQRTNLRNAPLQFFIARYVRWELGVASMPFKYRFGRTLNRKDANGNPLKVPNDVSTDINVGAYVGRKWGQTLFSSDPKRTGDRWGSMVSLFTGPTVIKLTKENISKSITQSSNEPGWQVGGGMWFSYRGIEVGTFLGIDIPLSYAGKSGDYANKMWLGFGLGYKLGILNLKDK